MQFLNVRNEKPVMKMFHFLPELKKALKKKGWQSD